jgi:hypothetical protein
MTLEELIAAKATYDALDQLLDIHDDIYQAYETAKDIVEDWFAKQSEICSCKRPVAYCICP